MEADFWREYRVDPLKIGWRKFRTLLGGLSPNSLFLQMLHEDQHGWKRALGAATGRDYSAQRRMTIDEYARSTS